MTRLADQIPFLSRCLKGTDIALLELMSGQDAVRLRRDEAGQVSIEPTSEPVEIKARSVGIFRRAHPLQATPLAQPGQHVRAGDPVGLLQIGPLLIHVVTPADGTVLDLLVEDGAAIGYGTPLVRVVGDKG